MDIEKNILVSIKMASEAAALAHYGQRRKHKQDPIPYIIHPARVANLTSYYNGRCYTCIIAAWMHDMVEDGGDKGYNLFVDAMNRMPLGDRDKEVIAGIVVALTKDDTITPRAAKNRNSINKVISDSAPHEAILVKICDRIDNLMDLEGFDHEFVMIYLNETRQLIEAVKNPAMIWGYHSAFHRLILLTEALEEAMR